MRLGIFGGSFDPVHYGHLLIAETCLQKCRLDQIWFVPAGVPPHKQNSSLTPAQQRIEMLHLAIAGHQSFYVSSIEVDRGGISYTVDTLREISSQQPSAELYFLMGADSLNDLPTWRDPNSICTLATPIVVRREGAPEPSFEVLHGMLPADRLHLVKAQQVEMPILEISSTELRRCVRMQQSIRYQTPRAVEKYIESHQLYTPQH